MQMSINKDIKEYISVFVGCLGMGSLYFQVLRMPIMAAMLLGVIFLNLCDNQIILKKNFKLYLAYCFVFSLLTLINYKNGFSVNEFVILIINILYIITLQSNMTFSNFKNKYVVIITVEAALSLVCYVWCNVLGNSLPFMTLYSQGIGSYYITPYYTAGWGNIGIFSRNAGMYTEPGAHQIFLNFALLFLLSSDDRCNFDRSKYRISIMILLITILTTQSTTGYMCLGVVFLAIAMKKREGNGNWKLKLFIILATGLLILIEMQTGVIETKLLGISTGQGSGLTRYNDTYYGYYIALKKPILGYGSFMSNQAEILGEYGIKNISNGMASFTIKNGIVVTAAFLTQMYYGIKEKLPYGVFFNMCCFILFILCVNSEGLFLNILFLCFIGKWRSDKEMICKNGEYRNVDNGF